MRFCQFIFACLVVSTLSIAGSLVEDCQAQAPTEKEATDAMLKAVAFFRENASAGGGYVFQITADLKRREGEGKVGTTTAWMEPPATPSVGSAYLEAYQLTGEPVLLEAAKETANALIRGQLESGGWDTKIEFAPEDRKRYAYRVDGTHAKNANNRTTFDDDKTQSAIRFMMQLDKELQFKDAAIHECAMTSLDAVLQSQYPCGAWPQSYQGQLPTTPNKPIKASFPDTWSRTYTKTSYGVFYTLNDNTISDLIETLLDAWDVYGDKAYLQGAIRGGDFLRWAQLPQPQPGWAQQYDADMHPVWARKFEPPAVSGGESQGVLRILLDLYQRTAADEKDAKRFLEPVPDALAYFKKSLRSDGKLARFYELKTNRPLYFTLDYQLTYEDTNMPTHYGFVVVSGLNSIERRYQKLLETPVEKLNVRKPRAVAKRSPKFDSQVQKIISQQDARGAWVEPGRLAYHKEDQEADMIRSVTFRRNLLTLAQWISANR